MDAAVKETLGNYPHTPGTDYLFANKDGKRMTWIKRSFRTALRRAGITDFHFHDCRHTFASHFMMNGGDLYTLAAILGHRSIDMTQRYAHLSPAYKLKMVKRMEKIWSKRSTEPGNGNQDGD